MLAVGILLIDRDRQRCPGWHLRIRSDVERRRVLLAGATRDRPARGGILINSGGGQEVWLLVVGLRRVKLHLARGLGLAGSTKEHSERVEHEVAVAGASRALRRQARVGQRLDPDRLQLEARGHDCLERVGILGQAAGHHHGAVGGDRTGCIRHALEFGRHERLGRPCGSGWRGGRLNRSRRRHRLFGWSRRRWRGWSGRRGNGSHRRNGGWRRRRQELRRRCRNEFAADMGAHEERFAVRREGHAPYARLRRLGAFLLPIGVDVPELHGAVEAAGGQPGTVR